MMTLLRGFHAIAAQRGDGLRPELLEMMSPSRAWSNVEKMENARVADVATTMQTDTPAEGVTSAEIVVLPVKRA